MKHAGVHAGLLVFFVAAAVAMTWPLAPNLHLAMAHPGDPLITSWILDWGYYAVTHQPSRLFHANIFHPMRYTLAFTENMFGVMLAMAPLFAAKVPLLALHNIAILAGFALAGYGAALLGRHLTGSVLAGIAAGIFFAFVPWRFTHLTHLQHLWTVWLPLLVLAMLRLLERPGRGRAAGFAAAFVMNGLTNLHWLAFGSFAIVFCVLIAGFFAERAAYGVLEVGGGGDCVRQSRPRSSAAAVLPRGEALSDAWPSRRGAALLRHALRVARGRSAQSRLWTAAQ